MADVLLITGVIVLLIVLSGFAFLAQSVTAWKRRRVNVFQTRGVTGSGHI